MENNSKLPFKAICIRDDFNPYSPDWSKDPMPKKGDVVTVEGMENRLGVDVYSLAEYPLGLFATTHFAPINPYSNSVSLELANEAIKERVEVDCPVKEVVN
jgi:hypothetical protein